MVACEIKHWNNLKITSTTLNISENIHELRPASEITCNHDIAVAHTLNVHSTSIYSCWLLLWWHTASAKRAVLSNACHMSGSLDQHDTRLDVAEMSCSWTGNHETWRGRVVATSNDRRSRQTSGTVDRLGSQLHVAFILGTIGTAQ